MIFRSVFLVVVSPQAIRIIFVKFWTSNGRLQTELRVQWRQEHSCEVHSRLYVSRAVFQS